MTKQYILSESEYMEIKCAIIDIHYNCERAEPSYTIGEIGRMNDRIRRIFGLIEDEDE
ncbi:MAG: hypothetical protein IIZ78_27795 [Clostridiales bacterium]|nr:hypothetical protein [Clostridiales bacterium]